MALTFRPIIDGFEAYEGERKIAVVRSRTHDGISFESVIKKRHFADGETKGNIDLRGPKEECHTTSYEDLDPDQWEIRFTGGHGTGAHIQEIMNHKPDYTGAIEDRE